MQEKVLNHATICLLLRGRRVLLPKKGKKIGKGKRNGFGGGIEIGETPEMCASRETREESGGIIVAPHDWQRVSVIDFHNQTLEGESFTCRCEILTARRWKGRAVSTTEMYDPRWYRVGELPFHEMLSADRVWLPLVLSHMHIYAQFWYGPRQSEMIRPWEVRDLGPFYNPSAFWQAGNF